MCLLPSVPPGNTVLGVQCMFEDKWRVGEK